MVESKLGGSDRYVARGERLGPGEALPDRERVQAFLAAVLQSEHLNVLVGSGLTTGLAKAAEADAVDMSSRVCTGDDDLDGKIEAAAEQSAKQMGRGSANVEDRLRVAIAIRDGLELAGEARAQDVASAVEETLDVLCRGITSCEAGILHGNSAAKDLAVSFLSTLCARVPTRDRVHIFTTNYDRAIEWSADEAGLRIIDRFVGTLQPQFRSSRLEVDYHYSPPGTVREPRHLDGVFRLTKLHGSLDWRWDDVQRLVFRDPAPFGGATLGPMSGTLIFPQAAKDHETTVFPYADLFRDFSAAICRPNSSLVTYGYGFGDDHINRAIEDMLTIASTHVTVLSFDDASGRVTSFLQRHLDSGQVSLLQGPTFAALGSLTRDWLPRLATDVLGRKQVDLLRSTSFPPGADRVQ